MELNVDMFIKLFDKDFKGSYAEAGRKLDVAPAQIYRIINKKGKAGVVFLGKFHTYCKEHKLKFEDYIIILKSNKDRKEA